MTGAAPTWRGPTAPVRPATRHEVADVGEGLRLAERSGWTDGLPVVLPTPGRVRSLLDAASLAPDDVLGVEPVKERVITAEKVAANAVLAGCEPAEAVVVAAAVRAMCRPEFLAHGATASTGGCAVLVVVSGPVATALGMTASHSALGGGDPVGLRIGRAVRLVLRNLLDARPGRLDRSTLGHPGKVSWCLAEDEAGGAPWVPLGSARGVAEGTSSVTVLAAGAPRQIMNEWTTDPEDLAETLAAEIRANMLHYSIWGGNYLIVVSPQLRAVFHAAGWSKTDLADAIHERARVERGQWETVGKGAVVSATNRERLHTALPDRDHLLVVSAGGDAGGFAAVVPPWLGTRSAAVTVALGAGR